MLAYDKMKTQLSSLYGSTVTENFKDWDRCALCKEYKSPLVWYIKNGRGKRRAIFVCEECYEKIKGAG